MREAHRPRGTGAIQAKEKQLAKDIKELKQRRDKITADPANNKTYIEISKRIWSIQYELSQLQKRKYAWTNKHDL